MTRGELIAYLHGRGMVKKSEGFVVRHNVGPASLLQKPVFYDTKLKIRYVISKTKVCTEYSTHLWKGDSTKVQWHEVDNVFLKDLHVDDAGSLQGVIQTPRHCSSSEEFDEIVRGDL